MTTSTGAVVAAVSLDRAHRFSKPNQDSITAIAGWGVEGDAHAGTTVQHRSRVARNPDQPNLRQIHLIHGELHDELRTKGFDVAAGQMGENVTTRGVDLLGLACGTRLLLGDSAVIEITGLRNPCVQLDSIAHGLMRALLSRDENGNVVRKAGVMGIVLTGGRISPGDRISIELPAPPHRPLEPV